MSSFIKYKISSTAEILELLQQKWKKCLINDLYEASEISGHDPSRICGQTSNEVAVTLEDSQAQTCNVIVQGMWISYELRSTLRGTVKTGFGFRQLQSIALTAILVYQFTLKTSKSFCF